MKKPSWTQSVLMSLAAGLSLQGHVANAAQFSTQTFISANSEITSLGLQLIDLSPSDGIAPSITFSMGQQTFFFSDKHQIQINGEVSYFQMATDQLLLSDPAGVTSASGIASGLMASDLMRAKVEISEQDFVAHAAVVQEGSYGYVQGKNFLLDEQSLVSAAGSSISFSLNRVVSDLDDNSPTGYIYRLEGEPEDVPFFTLAPNTGIVISGVMSTQFAIDADALSQYNADDMLINLGVSGGVVTHFLDPVDGSSSWTTAQAFEDAIGLSRVTAGGGYISSYCPEQYCTPQFVQQQAFNFSLNNASAADARGRLMAYVGTSLLLRAAPVPEPSTYALMALGLLGVAGAVRRRQA